MTDKIKRRPPLPVPPVDQIVAEDPPSDGGFGMPRQSAWKPTIEFLRAEQPNRWFRVASYDNATESSKAAANLRHQARRHFPVEVISRGDHVYAKRLFS